MRTSLPAAALAVLVLAAGVFSLLRPRGDPAPPVPAETLEPLVESPRPPVGAEAREPFLRSAPAPTADARRATRARAVLLEERNARAREHREAVALFEAGATSIRTVELAELSLLDARATFGEIDSVTLHRGRAVLLLRDAERTRRAADAGFIAEPEVEKATLAVERERLLAGDVNEYAARRQRFLEATKERHRSLAEAGLAAAKTLAEDYARLEAEFPAASDLRDVGAR